jgi:hypothetical protein
MRNYNITVAIEICSSCNSCITHTVRNSYLGNRNPEGHYLESLRDFVPFLETSNQDTTKEITNFWEVTSYSQVDTSIHQYFGGTSQLHFVGHQVPPKHL